MKIFAGRVLFSKCLKTGVAGTKGTLNGVTVLNLGVNGQKLAKLAYFYIFSPRWVLPSFVG